MKVNMKNLAFGILMMMALFTACNDSFDEYANLKRESKQKLGENVAGEYAMSGIVFLEPTEDSVVKHRLDSCRLVVSDYNNGSPWMALHGMPVSIFADIIADNDTLAARLRSITGEETLMMDYDFLKWSGENTSTYVWPRAWQVSDGTSRFTLIFKSSLEYVFRQDFSSGYMLQLYLDSIIVDGVALKSSNKDGYFGIVELRTQSE